MPRPNRVIGHLSPWVEWCDELEQQLSDMRESLQLLHDIMLMGGFDCPELDQAKALLQGERGMSDRYLPFSNDDLERDMQDRQNCRVCGRTCSSTVGLCRSPVCTAALVEQLEAELAALREALLSAPPCKTEKYMNGETKVMGGPAIDRYYHWYTKIRRKALQEKGE